MSSDSELEDGSLKDDVLRYGPLRYVDFAHNLHISAALIHAAEFNYSVPGVLVSVKVKDGSPFRIPLEVLVEDSDYFARALLRPPKEGNRDSIDIDISSKDFGIYVSVMYPATLCDTELTLHQVWPTVHDKLSVHHPWPQILLLWQLGHRFVNRKVMSMADAALNSRFHDYSASKWQGMYESKSEATLKARMLRLQNAFRLCQDKRLPFGPSFVTAASQAPPQVFAACVDELDDEVFKSKVTRAFALRFADSVSTAKKRRRDE